MRNIIIIIFIIVITVIWSPAAHAAGIDLGIHPPILQIQALPPAKIQAPITIKNLGQDPVDLSIVLKPFKPSALENGEILFSTSSDLHPSAEIRENNLPITTLTLAPGQQKIVTLHIDVGKNEPTSDYYFSIVFISKDSKSDQRTRLVISEGIATNVLLSIGTKGKGKGEIEEFSTPFFVEKGPVAFTLRLKNAGSHVITPKGGILIENMFGQTIGKVELLPVNILSDSIRAIPDSFQSPPGNFKFQISNFKFPKAFWHESFLLGPYKAKLTVALSDQGPVFTRTIRFIALPWQAVAGGAITLILLLIITYRVRLKLNS